MAVSYTNQTGEKVIIEQMNDYHLLAAFAKYKKRVKLLDNITRGNKEFIKDYQRKLQNIVTMLFEEIQKRGLNTPIDNGV